MSEVSQDASPMTDGSAAAAAESCSQPVSPSREFLIAVGPATAAAFVVRAAVAIGLMWTVPLGSDALDYFREAQAVASGSREAAPFYWPPGMTFLLAFLFDLLGSTVIVTRVALVLLGTLQTLFVARLTMQLTGKPQAAKLAAWLWAIYPPAVLLTSQPYSQHLAGFCLIGAAVFGLQLLRHYRLRDALLTGGLIGVGCLSRPSMMSLALLLPVAAAVAVWWQAGFRLKQLPLKQLGKSAGMVCVSLVMVGAVLAPVLWHNARTGGGAALSTNNERNLFLGNNPYTPLYKTSQLAQRPFESAPPEVQQYLLQFYEHPDPRTAMKQEAIRHVLSHPGTSLLRTFNRTCAFWGFDYLSSRVLHTLGAVSLKGSILVLLLEAGGYALTMLLVLAGLCGMWRECSPAPLVWLVLVVLAYAGPYSLAFSGGTYHFPVIPVLLPLAGLALSAGWPRLRALLISSRAVQLAVVLFTLVQLEYAWFAVQHFGDA